MPDSRVHAHSSRNLHGRSAHFCRTPLTQAHTHVICMHWLRTLAAVILIGTLASGCNSRGAMNATLPVPEQSPRSAALTIPAPHSTKLDIAPRPHSRAATRHAATAIKPLSLAESVVLPSPTQISLSVSHDAASVPAFNLHVLQPESTQLPMSSGIPLSYRQSIDLGVWPAGGTRLVAVAGGRTVVDTGVVDFAPLAGSAITVVAVDNEWTSEGAGSPIELRVHLPHFDSESPHNPSPLNSRSIEPGKTGLEAVAKEHVRQVMHRSPVPRPEGSTLSAVPASPTAFLQPGTTAQFSVNGP